MVAVGWLVLALVFVDELLAAGAAAVWGTHESGLLLAIAMVVVVVGSWWAFASPKAPLGGPVVRPVTKVLVFGLAGLGLWAAGHHGWAVAFLVFSVVVNALAQLPSIQALVSEAETGGRGGHGGHGGRGQRDRGQQDRGQRDRGQQDRGQRDRGPRGAAGGHSA